MAGQFRYTRPDELFSLNGAVAATVDSDYTAAWLVDQRPGRPIRGTSGSFSATITNPSAEVGIVAIAQHNVSVNVVVSGGVSGTITPATTQADGIPLNAYTTVTPTAIVSLGIAITSNPSTVIAKIFAGKLRTLSNYTGGRGGPRYADVEFTDDDYANAIDGEFSSIPPYDKGLESRRLTGSGIYSAATFAELRAWRKAQKSMTLPSLIVPDDTVNDVWVCQFRPMKYRPITSDAYEVTLDFVEYPRSRW